MKVNDRIKHAWNAFVSNDRIITFDRGPSSSRPRHRHVTFFNTSSYVSSIYNRIAMDVSMTGFKHVKVNPTNEDVTDMTTGLNDCLTVEANIDQTHIQFIQDLVYSMFDEGVVAVVPTQTTIDPEVSASYDIGALRVGKIVSWFPKHVEVDLYNDETGQNERIFIAKKNCSIIENPLYAIVNDENSTLKRLIRKLNQLDDIDALAASNRLDLLVSVPYTAKSTTQKQNAKNRIADIEEQLLTSRHGIAYIEGTEKVTQLNRPVNPQLPETIERLTQQFYNQLGLTQSIFNGTASESELRTYYSRAIDPIVENIIAEFTRKFLTKTARTQGQRIVAYRDMFKLVAAETIANLGDALRRNSIASSNEIRKWVGLRPSSDPRADELFNPNIADKNQNVGGAAVPKPSVDNLKETERIEDEVMRE